MKSKGYEVSFWRRKNRKKFEYLFLAVLFLLYLLFGVYTTFGVTPFVIFISITVVALIIKKVLQPDDNYRKTASRVLGRKLERNEIVHHMNGNRADNSVGNLCVMDGVKHELFHTWLRWKKEKSGHSPPMKHQKFILKDEYGAIILSEYQKPNDFKDEEHIEKRPEDTSTEIEKVVDELYEELRKFRNQLARDKNIPPYMIFSNETLMELADKSPMTMEAFAEIKGVGKIKLREYGSLFLEKIKSNLPKNKQS